MGRFFESTIRLLPQEGQKERTQIHQNTMSEQIDTSQSLLPAQVVPEQYKQVTTAAQAKVDAVANLTMKAYERAATLQITPEESAALQADFPDEAFKPGAAGKEHLIYIEHAFLRDRMNQVFGLGQWSLIPRSRWAEDFEFTNKYNKLVQASRVYVEAMLVVRGCFVAEAVGDMVYYKNNEGQNYGDAVEGAKTAALRRCAKEFGIGLQAWKKDWCEGWWKRRNAPRTVSKVSEPHPSPQNAPQGTPEPPKATSEDTSGPKRRLKALNNLHAAPGQPMRGVVTHYFMVKGWITAEQQPEDWPIAFVPKTKEEMVALAEDVQKFETQMRGEAQDEAS